MRLYLIDISEDKIKSVKKYFGTEENVNCISINFLSFMERYTVDCVVSPANAFGLMDGGYDKAISEYFGEELQKKVQREILGRWGGHQPLGTALTVSANEKIKLIHVPTMCVPSKIKDPFLIYECMRATLYEAKSQGIQAIVIPLFGGLTGQVDAETVAKMMWLGYKHVTHPQTEINWDVAWSVADEFADYGVPIE